MKLFIVKTKIILIVFVFCSLQTLAQDKAPYVIYNKYGKAVKYQRLLREATLSDVILFGEYHNNPISHWLQLELTKDLHDEVDLMLGAEMFEADNQSGLNQYLSGKISAKMLDSAVRLWPNYKTDYAPLVNFAKDQNIPFIATNIPRRFARLVHKNGGFKALDNLSAQEKKWIAPLPPLFDPELPEYKKMAKMMGGHASPDIIKAQAIKDATMAHFILKNYSDQYVFLHFNGAFHSNFYEGILWYLQQENGELDYLTITTVEQKDNEYLQDEHLGKADFIICVDADMTKTY